MKVNELASATIEKATTPTIQVLSLSRGNAVSYTHLDVYKRQEDRTLSEAIDLMSRKKIRRMLVTKDGEITGIFTQRDILGLSRLCLYCGKDIRSVLEYGSGADRYIECECGSRYHTRCANSVVHCVDCSKTIVANVTYPCLLYTSRCV